MVSSRATACGDGCQLASQTITSRRSCQLIAPWGTQCEAATSVLLQWWTACPRCALLKSSFLVPVDRVAGAEVTGLERRCIEQWHDLWELHSQ